MSLIFSLIYMIYQKSMIYLEFVRQQKIKRLIQSKTTWYIFKFSKTLIASVESYIFLSEFFILSILPSSCVYFRNKASGGIYCVTHTLVLYLLARKVEFGLRAHFWCWGFGLRLEAYWFSLAWRKSFLLMWGFRETLWDAFDAPISRWRLRQLPYNSMPTELRFFYLSRKRWGERIQQEKCVRKFEEDLQDFLGE